MKIVVFNQIADIFTLKDMYFIVKEYRGNHPKLILLDKQTELYQLKNNYDYLNLIFATYKIRCKEKN